MRLHHYRNLSVRSNLISLTPLSGSPRESANFKATKRPVIPMITGPANVHTRNFLHFATPSNALLALSSAA